MSWGVEALDVPERIGFAVTQSGVDLISGLFDNAEGREAYARATNGYYDTHPVPEGFKRRTWSSPTPAWTAPSPAP